MRKEIRKPKTDDMDTDMERFLLAGRGDKKSLYELFEQNKKRIYSIAYHYTKNRQDAEDILQITFIKAFNGMKNKKFTTFSHFSAWLYKIGVNSSIDYLRKHRKRYIEEKDMASTDIEDVRAPNASPEEIFIQDRLIGTIEEILDTFSPKQRMIFILKYYQHLTINEIALQLQCSKGSVKKQLFRVSSKLKENLGSLRVKEAR
jgi:RNA polymerase sigma-70 factor (ECF subfamily)